MLHYRDCRLRPINEKDLEILLEWRNSDRIRSNMYNDHLITMEEHRAWFICQASKEIQTSLIFELDGKPLGVINLSKIDSYNNKCHWGFYVGETDTPKGCGLALGFLGLEYIFDNLQIRKLIGETFAFNQSSIAFHQKFGFSKEGYLSRHFLKNGVYEDIVLFALFRDDWLTSKDSLKTTCFGHEKLL
ncbi:MAG: UDP-4-amino-4,6-dideoxy-N-acetyl-beta-L-altrosamine N-acetyltransferase [Desulfobulbus sp.]|nr:UDP-4-amino-4,6-dideoxy-N-acetyl-beta-L-altrosamine N-acetyltransferase [Desulfobulbus sp.]